MEIHDHPSSMASDTGLITSDLPSFSFDVACWLFTRRVSRQRATGHTEARESTHMGMRKMAHRNIFLFLDTQKDITLEHFVTRVINVNPRRVERKITMTFPLLTLCAMKAPTNEHDLP